MDRRELPRGRRRQLFGQEEREASPELWAGIDREEAPVVLHGEAGHEESQARPLRLRRGEGIKDGRSSIGLDAGAVVGDLHLEAASAVEALLGQPAAGVDSRSDRDLFPCRFLGVPQEVADRLSNSFGIALNRGEGRVQIEVPPDWISAERGPQQRDFVVDQAIEVDL